MTPTSSTAPINKQVFDEMTTMFHYIPKEAVKIILDTQGGQAQRVRYLRSQDFTAFGFDPSDLNVLEAQGGDPSLAKVDHEYGIQYYRKDSIQDMKTYETSNFDLVLVIRSEEITEGESDIILRNIFRVSRQYVHFSMPLGDLSKDWWDERFKLYGYEYATIGDFPEGVFPMKVKKINPLYEQSKQWQRPHG